MLFRPSLKLTALVKRKLELIPITKYNVVALVFESIFDLRAAVRRQMRERNVCEYTIEPINV